MQAAWEAGRRAWPTVPLGKEAFAGFAADRGLERAALAERAADLYIVCACVNQVEGAAQAFAERYLADVRAITGTVGRGCDDDYFDEVRQRLSERLLVGDAEQPPRLAQYAGRGPLAGWVRMAAMRCALELTRGQKRRREGELVEQAVGGIDGELAFLKQRYRQHFIDAFRDALGSASAESRALLRLHYLEQVTTGALAALHGVSRPTIVRRLATAREEVLAAVREGVRARLSLEASEYDSLLDLVRSQIDVSLAGMLRGLDKP